MRTLIFTAAVLAAFSQGAAAATQVMFAKDGSKATVMMLAVTTNPDAVAFDAALNLPQEDNNGKATRKLQFRDSQDNPTLDLACAFSKLAPDTGSCFVTFRPLGGVELNAGSKQIRYILEGVDAERLLAAFKYTPGQPVFVSSDNLFRIEFQKSAPAVLVLTYN